jgi:hypothetical protein
MSAPRLRFEPVDAPDTEPALQAWRSIAGGRRPARVERLVESRRNRAYERARIFRLVAAGPRGEDIVAKGAPSRTLAVEARVYGEILPRLGLSAPAYHGYLDDGADAWLFMEQIDGEPFSHRSPAHADLAASWLAGLHVGTSAWNLADRLPAETPEAYLRCLVSARESLMASRDVVPAAAGTMLAALIETLDRIEAAWPAACRHCAAMPHCLVHADFVNKNVRVVRREGVDQLMVLDWGIAGWGAPAPDLEHLDPVKYFALVRAGWPQLQAADVATMKAIGIAMRHLGLIEVWAASLRDQPEWAMQRLAESSALLARACADLPGSSARVEPTQPGAGRAQGRTS